MTSSWLSKIRNASVIAASANKAPSGDRKLPMLWRNFPYHAASVRDDSAVGPARSVQIRRAEDVAVGIDDHAALGIPAVIPAGEIVQVAEGPVPARSRQLEDAA